MHYRSPVFGDTHRCLMRRVEDNRGLARRKSPLYKDTVEEEHFVHQGQHV